MPYLSLCSMRQIASLQPPPMRILKSPRYGKQQIANGWIGGPRYGQKV